MYAYPAEHYEFWQRELPDLEFSWGSFGENLTIEGLLEKELNVGDRLCAGSVEPIVTEPRLPCCKLNAKFLREDMVKRLLRSRRTGCYFSVAREGEIGSGDAIRFPSHDENRVSVADITRLYAFDRNDFSGMRRAAAVKALPESWRSYFAERVGKSTA